MQLFVNLSASAFYIARVRRFGGKVGLVAIVVRARGRFKSAGFKRCKGVGLSLALRQTAPKKSKAC